MKRINWFWIIGGLVVVAVLAGGALFLRQRALNAQTSGTATTATQTAQVTTLTAVNSVESSGAVEPLQLENLSWKTTGTVAGINVKVGQTVHAGDVLMTIDPASAPQSVIQAQADLISARKTLKDLLNPKAMDVANAQKAVADAEQTLKDAKQDLVYAQNPAGKSLYDAVTDAKLALDNAQTNSTLAHVGQQASDIKTAENTMNLAYSRLQRAQTAMDDCNEISCGERDQRDNELTAAQNNYQTALDNYQAAKLKYDNSVTNQTSDVTKAQEDYDQAVANLNAALAGPDQLKVQTAQAKVSVAEADLADAQDTLNKLTNGADPDDIASAQARVMAAQATLDNLSLKAPFDGQVLQVNYQKGDTASQTETAVVLANLSQMHVDVSVDESDVSQLADGNAVAITFDSLPELSLNGQVSEIMPFGTTVQGLVKYTVRVKMANIDPKVFIGMTANVNIVTSTTQGALAVPLNAIQLDGAHEFVNRVKTDGTLERVNVVSGLTQDELVVVTGELKPGDVVQVLAPKSSSTIRGPFGGG